MKFLAEKRPIIYVFSAYSNLKKLLSVRKTGDENLDCLAGMKVISSWFVVMGHCYIMYMIYPNANSLVIVDVR